MFRIIETTTDQLMVAEKISQSIIGSKLAPCIQIIDGVKSNYTWKDKIESSNEYIIKIKTVENHINKISSIIKEESIIFDLLPRLLSLIPRLFAIDKWCDSSKI